jgi:hypothetical protein
MSITRGLVRTIRGLLILVLVALLNVPITDVHLHAVHQSINHHRALSMMLRSSLLPANGQYGLNRASCFKKEFFL